MGFANPGELQDDVSSADRRWSANSNNDNECIMLRVREAKMETPRTMRMYARDDVKSWRLVEVKWQ